MVVLLCISTNIYVKGNLQVFKIFRMNLKRIQNQAAYPYLFIMVAEEPIILICCWSMMLSWQLMVSYQLLIKV